MRASARWLPLVDLSRSLSWPPAPQLPMLHSLLLPSSLPRHTCEPQFYAHSRCACSPRRYTRRLESLSVSRVEKITDNGIAWLTKGCTQLTYLNLSGCVDVTDVGLRHVALRCRILRSLHLSQVCDPRNCVSVREPSRSNCLTRRAGSGIDERHSAAPGARLPRPSHACPLRL